MVMMDAVDESEVATIPAGEAFRARFRNPYAVIHRADIHQSIYEEVALADEYSNSARRRASTGSTSARTACGSRIQHGGTYEGAALIGCDGVKSVVREQLIGDPHRVSGHVVYRGVVARDDMPERPALECRGDLGRSELPSRPLSAARRRAVQPRRHVPQPRARGVGRARGLAGRSAVVFHRDRDRAARGCSTSRRRGSAGRRRIAIRSSAGARGRATLLGDAAHPMLQYMAQGACDGARGCGDACARRSAPATSTSQSALPAVRVEAHRPHGAPGRTRRARWDASITRKGVERLVRNSLWKGRTPERFYDALEWLYGWTAEGCLR